VGRGISMAVAGVLLFSAKAVLVKLCYINDEDADALSTLLYLS